tara:strand:+ start:46 stop:216 length:171 start_codon:yes stop_codon:yes gene_type:complete
MINYDEGKYALPDHRPLTEAEWDWIIMMRSANGGRLPKLTLKSTQEFQLFLRKAAD